MTPNLHKYISQLADSWTDLTVVEIGARSAPGQEHMHLADVIEQANTYIGIDLEDGRHIDYTVDITDVSRESDVGDVIAEADVVLCLEALEHMPRFWKALEVFSWMKKGTTLIISVPTFGFPYHPHPVDCYRFHEDALAGLTEGFETVETLRRQDTARNETLIWRGVKL